MNLWSHPDAETRKIVEIVNKTKRNTFLEIGCFRFSLTINFILMSKEPNLIIANDKIDHSPETRELIDKYHSKLFKFVLGDSGLPSTQDTIKGILKGRKLDILLIDGDHGKGHVEIDTRTYVDLVDDDGYIIWHDTMRGAGKLFEPWFIEKLQQNVLINLYFEGESRIGWIQGKEWKRYMKNLKPTGRME